MGVSSVTTGDPDGLAIRSGLLLVLPRLDRGQSETVVATDRHRRHAALTSEPIDLRSCDLPALGEILGSEQATGR